MDNTDDERDASDKKEADTPGGGVRHFFAITKIGSAEIGWVINSVRAAPRMEGGLAED